MMPNREVNDSRCVDEIYIDNRDLTPAAREVGVTLTDIAQCLFDDLALSGHFGVRVVVKAEDPQAGMVLAEQVEERITQAVEVAMELARRSPPIGTLGERFGRLVAEAEAEKLAAAKGESDVVR